MPVTNYIWDVVSDNVLMEKDDEGETIASYVQEPGLYGEVISQKRDGQTRYYNFDGEGNTSELTDENGNVTDTYEYSAFGKEIARTGTTENPFGYKGAIGYYTNQDVCEVYVRERSFRSGAGRWSSKDPLDFEDGPNLYVNVFNNPIVRSDPSGLYCCCEELRVTKSGFAPYDFGRYYMLGDELGYCIKPLHFTGGKIVFQFGFRFVVSATVQGNVNECRYEQTVDFHATRKGLGKRFEKVGDDTYPSLNPPVSNGTQVWVDGQTVHWQDSPGWNGQKANVDKHQFPAHFGAKFTQKCISGDPPGEELTVSWEVFYYVKKAPAIQSSRVCAQVPAAPDAGKDSLPTSDSGPCC